MGEVSIIGLDLAKNVLQAHCAGADGSVVFRRKLSRAQLLKLFAAQPPCVVAMEACASSHYWGRAIGDLGHEVRLIPPAYVKPFVKRQKNDMADAEAKLRVLTVVDTFSRYVPVLDARYRYRGEDVVATLDRVCRTAGYPKTIRVDQGSEFVSRDMDLWAYQRGVVLDFSRPGKPTDNAFVEAFNARIRSRGLDRLGSACLQVQGKERPRPRCSAHENDRKIC